jgi:hypothetical protein
MFALFFDMMTGLVGRAHGELASLSLLLGFKKTPQVVTPQPATHELEVRALNDVERDAFLAEFHSILVTNMRGAGSLADPKANVALEMYYLNIDETTGDIQAASPRYERVSSAFYTGPDLIANDCFDDDGERAQHQADFDTFVNGKIADIDTYAGLGTPLGKRLPVFSISGSSSNPYANRRTIIFYMTCYRPFMSFVNKGPRLSTYVWLPDKETSWRPG